MYKSINRISALFLILLSLALFSSCKVGSAINEFKRKCPITLAEGIVITDAESHWSSLRNVSDVVITVRINTFQYSLPSSDDSSEWYEIFDALYQLAKTDNDYNELLRVVKNGDQKAQVCFKVIDNFDTERKNNIGI